MAYPYYGYQPNYYQPPHPPMQDQLAQCAGRSINPYPSR